MPSVNPHAPRIGLIRRLLGPFHVTGVFWYWLPNFGTRVAPLWAFTPVERLFALAFHPFLVNIRRAVCANLRVVLGPCNRWEDHRRAARTFAEFAYCYGDRYESLAFPERFSGTLEGEEHWRAARESGKGLIFVTAHIGAWNMSSVFAASETAMTFHVVREEELDPRSQRFMERLIGGHRSASFVTHFAKGDPLLSVSLLHALERGEIVSLQGDRPRAGSRTVRASLLGRPFDIPAGPLILARASQAPIVPIFTFREKRHVYRTVFREPIHVSPEGPAGQVLAEAAGLLGSHIEWAIRHRPHHWFAFGRVWPDEH